MGTIIDMTGQRFGKLLVLERDPQNRGGKACWICQCDCGTVKSVLGTSLRQGKTTSCGCGIAQAAATRGSRLEGQRFGRLVVIEDSGERVNGKKVWKCKCDCGNTVNVPTTYLTTGDTKSCGCLQKERTSETRRKDLTNQVFGSLTALRATEERKSGQIVWECKCTCGNLHYVTTSDLTTGHTTSCGCMKYSQGALAVASLLHNNNIDFLSEYTFNDCRFSDTNKIARFDFYVNNTYIIEFDGIQHFKATSGWNTQEKYEQTRAHDEIKNKYCKDNNIPLIRIPYTHLQDLCLEDLLLETTQFLVK